MVKIRTITATYNEEKLLPHFLRHYSNISDSIIIWDNGSTDCTLEIAKSFPKVEVRTYETGGLNAIVKSERFESTRAESTDFDWCLLVDCDEFLVSNIGKSEREILEGRTDADVLRTSGWQMTQGKNEDPIDFSKNLFPQRRFGFPGWNKPIVIRSLTPVKFGPGCHDFKVRTSVRILSEPHILFLHYDAIDKEFWISRKTNRIIDPAIQGRGMGMHRNLPREQYERQWVSYQAATRQVFESVRATTT